MTDRQIAYRRYLRSGHWRQLRSQVLSRDGKCTRCPSTTRLQAHHLLYRTPLESCTAEDLVTLCRRCHMRTHGLLGDLFWEMPVKHRRMTLAAILMRNEGFEPELVACFNAPMVRKPSWLERLVRRLMD